MAKAKVVHSTDAATIVFKGDVSNPEPSHGIVTFPGGTVEVARASDGEYWAHIAIDETAQVTGSRIDYDYEGAKVHGIPDLPDGDSVQHIAVKIKGPLISHD